jgi:hypothetical protein
MPDFQAFLHKILTFYIIIHKKSEIIERTYLEIGGNLGSDVILGSGQVIQANKVAVPHLTRDTPLKGSLSQEPDCR